MFEVLINWIKYIRFCFCNSVKENMLNILSVGVIWYVTSSCVHVLGLSWFFHVLVLCWHLLLHVLVCSATEVFQPPPPPDWWRWFDGWRPQQTSSTRSSVLSRPIYPIWVGHNYQHLWKSYGSHRLTAAVHCIYSVISTLREANLNVQNFRCLLDLLTKPFRM